MKTFKLFMSVMLLCLAMSGIAQAQNRIADYLYPEGRSTYYIHIDKNKSPMEKVSVLYERSKEGMRISEDPPIPLIGSLMYKNTPEMTCYILDITETTVTAHTWWTKSIDDTGDKNSRNNLVLLKLPVGKEPITWTTSVNENGKILQIWEMSAKRSYMAVEKDGSWIAVPALEVKRNVFDADHKPLAGQSVVEYWQQGAGKVKVVRIK